MESVDRLVAAGVHPNTAVDTVIWFIQRGDDTGLEEYVQEVEERHRNGNAIRLGASDR